MNDLYYGITSVDTQTQYINDNWESIRPYSVGCSNQSLHECMARTPMGTTRVHCVDNLESLKVAQARQLARDLNLPGRGKPANYNTKKGVISFIRSFFN